jgi:aspartate aminotransferase-like enzyme
MTACHFKIATEAWEFEQIKSLNYETFVEEIGQHEANAQRSLTDAFDAENTYIIGVRGRQVLAMLAVRGKRPFSLDKKLANLDSYLPEGKSLCEVRLLAARSSIRHSRIVRGLLAETVGYCIAQGYETALISGILEQVKLYRHLGFVPFGPVVGTNGVQFQPMYLTIEGHAAAKASFLGGAGVPVNLLPGPVTVSDTVRAALTAPELSHRGEAYLRLHHQTQQRLCELTGAGHVQIFTGSGTLANDVIAGQLSLLGGKGLILSNGEFGERLVRQARCFGLDFETLSAEWGHSFGEQPLRDKASGTADLRWMWAVYCESSTGMLNDAQRLRSIAKEYRVHLCLDCVSAIGNTPVNLNGIYLASACSSKGLRSVAGLAMVFYSHALSKPDRPLPVYLDLYAYEKAGGVPFTIPSNLTGALAAALKEGDFEKHLSQTAALDRWVRVRLGRLGLVPLAEGREACPGIITCRLAKPLCSRSIGDRLKEAGFLISYESRYLLERNWIQICLMSDISKPRLRGFIDHLGQLLRN